MNGRLLFIENKSVFLPWSLFQNYWNKASDNGYLLRRNNSDLKYWYTHSTDKECEAIRRIIYQEQEKTGREIINELRNFKYYGAFAAEVFPSLLNTRLDYRGESMFSFAVDSNYPDTPLWVGTVWNTIEFSAGDFYIQIEPSDILKIEGTLDEFKVFLSHGIELEFTDYVQLNRILSRDPNTQNTAEGIKKQLLDFFNGNDSLYELLLQTNKNCFPSNSIVYVKVTDCVECKLAHERIRVHVFRNENSWKIKFRHVSDYFDFRLEMADSIAKAARECRDYYARNMEKIRTKRA